MFGGPRCAPMCPEGRRGKHQKGPRGTGKGPGVSHGWGGAERDSFPFRAEPAATGPGLPPVPHAMGALGPFVRRQGPNNFDPLLRGKKLVLTGGPAARGTERCQGVDFR